MKTNRRTLLKTVAGGTAAIPFAGFATTPPAVPTAKSDCPPAYSLTWARGAENQRMADLGDGRYLNPILPGDRPDPTILKDGDDSGIW